MLQKNLNADMTNPNVAPEYHSIDDNFEDHVYDEIKGKDGYPGEFFCVVLLLLFFSPQKINGFAIIFKTIHYSI